MLKGKIKNVYIDKLITNVHHLDLKFMNVFSLDCMAEVISHLIH